MSYVIRLLKTLVSTFSRSNGPTNLFSTFSQGRFTPATAVAAAFPFYSSTRLVGFRATVFEFTDVWGRKSLRSRRRRLCTMSRSSRRHPASTLSPSAARYSPRDSLNTVSATSARRTLELCLKSGSTAFRPSNFKVSSWRFFYRK